AFTCIAARCLRVRLNMSPAFSTIRTPSGRTQGAPAVLNRDAAEAVVLERSALKVLALASGASVAAFWQALSAAAMPWSADHIVLVATKAIRFCAGATGVTAVDFDVPRQ